MTIICTIVSVLSIVDLTFSISLQSTTTPEQATTSFAFFDNTGGLIRTSGLTIRNTSPQGAIFSNRNGDTVNTNLVVENNILNSVRAILIDFEWLLKSRTSLTFLCFSACRISSTMSKGPFASTAVQSPKIQSMLMHSIVKVLLQK